MAIRIGTSGWSYDHWSGVLYPPRTPPARRLAHYAAEFRTVELNASFYRWPGDAAFTSWRSRLPDGFRMSVKAPRGLTHARRLRDPETWVERVARGWRALEDKRGVVLVQLSPGQERDDARLERFLSCLPGDLPVAVELRHASWHHDAVFDLLERHLAAYVVMSGAGLPRVLRATASFVYIRLHGPHDAGLYCGSYSDGELAWWGDRIRAWSRAGREVWVYFNNDAEGNAVRNARTLRGLLGV